MNKVSATYKQVDGSLHTETIELPENSDEEMFSAALRELTNHICTAIRYLNGNHEKLLIISDDGDLIPLSK